MKSIEKILHAWPLLLHTCILPPALLFFHSRKARLLETQGHTQPMFTHALLLQYPAMAAYPWLQPLTKGGGLSQMQGLVAQALSNLEAWQVQNGRQQERQHPDQMFMREMHIMSQLDVDHLTTYQQQQQQQRQQQQQQQQQQSEIGRRQVAGYGRMQDQQPQNRQSSTHEASAAMLGLCSRAAGEGIRGPGRAVCAMPQASRRNQSVTSQLLEEPVPLDKRGNTVALLELRQGTGSTACGAAAEGSSATARSAQHKGPLIVIAPGAVAPRMRYTGM